MVDIAKEFHETGFLLRENIIQADVVKELKDQLEKSIELEAKRHTGQQFLDYGMLLAAPVYGGPLLRLIEFEPLFSAVNELLGEACIVHVYTSSSLPPFSQNYGTRIHRERSNKYPNIADFVAMIILLDDFTEQNGATWYLPGSHRMVAPPDSDSFYRHAKRLVAPAGSVFYFDWRLYHAGGENQTQYWRHALAMGLTPAYQKQKIDLPRAIPAEFAKGINDFARQKLGYFSQPPVSVEDYYKPVSERSYRQPPV